MRSFCLGIVFLLAGLYPFHQAAAQSDTLFWFAVPHVQQIGSLSNAPFAFHFENGGLDTVVVTLDVPANTAFVPMQVVVWPRNRGTIDVTPFIPSLSNQMANTPQNKGVRIRASKPVQAYFEVGSASCGCNQEYFGLKGNEALGLLFYAGFRTIWANDSSSGIVPAASIDIVAVENGTQLNIVSPVALQGISAATTSTVLLNAGQTYTIRSVDWRLINKPNGVKITASKPIAISLTDEQVQVGSCADLTGDQIVPVANLKTTYPVLKGNLMVPDLVTVMAVHDNTRIVFEGSAQPDVLLNAGEFRSILVTVAVHTIKANKPLYAVQYSGIGCSVGMSVLPGLSCNLDSVYGFQRENLQPLIFNFIIPTGYQDSIRINGGLPAQVISGVHFSILPGTQGAYMWAVFELHHTIIGAGMPIRISAPVGFSVGVRHGNPSNGMRFASFGDYTGDPYFNLNVDTLICAGDTVRLIATHDQIWSPMWHLPQGQVFFGDTLVVPNFGLGNQGWYKFQLLDGTCIPRIDSVWLNLAPNQVAIELNPPTRDTLCAGDTVVLRARLIAGSGIQWHNAQGPILSATADSLVVDASGSYYAIATAPCADPDTTVVYTIFVDSVLNIQYSLSDTILCRGDSVLLIHQSGSARGGVLLQYPDGSIRRLQEIDSIWISNSGSFALWYQTANCSYDTVYFNIYEAPVPPVLQGQNLLRCVPGEAILWWPGRATSFLWYKDGVLIAASNDSVIRVTQSGYYSLGVVTNYRCYPDTLWQDTLLVYEANVTARLQASQISGAKPLMVTFDAQGATGHVRQWFINGIPSSVDSLWQQLFDQRGRYSIRLELRDTIANCSDDTTVMILVFDSAAVLFPTAFSPNADGKNDHYLPVLVNAEFVDLSIYNSWGELVFWSRGAAPGWDGRHRGEAAAPGRYVCVVRFQADVGDIAVKSSDFILLR